MNENTRTPLPATGTAVPASTVAPSAVGEGQLRKWLALLDENANDGMSPEDGWGDLMDRIRDREDRLYGSMKKTLESLAAQAPKPASAGGELVAFSVIYPNQVRSLQWANDSGERDDYDDFDERYGEPKRITPLYDIAAEADTAITNTDAQDAHVIEAMQRRRDPPAADRLAQTVTYSFAQSDAAKNAMMEVLVDALRCAREFIDNGRELGFIRMPSGDDPAHRTPKRVHDALTAYTNYIRARESAPAQEGIREAVMRVMRVERDHAIEVFCAADGQSSPKTREEFKAAWDALNELLPLAAAPRAGS